MKGKTHRCPVLALSSGSLSRVLQLNTSWTENNTVHILIYYWTTSYSYDRQLPFCRVGNLLFSSFALVLLLKIAQIKERPWVIGSGRSWQKSIHEQIAQDALNKKATMSNCSGCSFVMSNQSESLKKMCDWFEKMLANSNAKEQIAPFALGSVSLF